MRSTILFLLVLFVPILLFSQNNEYQEFYDGAYAYSGAGQKPRVKTFAAGEIIRNYDFSKITNEQMEIEFIRYCNYRFIKQRSIAYGFWAGSLGLATVGGLTDPTENNTLFLATLGGAGALGLAGIVILIDADKWLRYSSIKPSRHGIGITITF